MEVFIVDFGFLLTKEKLPLSRLAFVQVKPLNWRVKTLMKKRETFFTRRWSPSLQI